MKISHIETIPYRIPYTTPLEFATGKITEVENVLVKVHTDEGLVGIGEAPSRPYIYGESQASIIYAIQNWFLPSLRDIDLLSTEHVWQAMNWVKGNQTARAAIDMAIWDIRGKIYKQPCHRLLGGWTTQINVSHMIGFDTADNMVKHAHNIQERYGISHFKIKVGKNITQDIRACKALRKALPEAHLYLDANHGWTSQEAMLAAESLRDDGLLFFEEPSSSQDRIGRRKLSQMMSQPVCGDESCTTLKEVAQEINDGISSFICIKTARTGFTESAKIAALCEGMSVPVYIGNQGDTQLGTLANIQFACSMHHTSKNAAELTNYLDIADDLSAEPIVIRDGKVQVNSEPGSGLVVDNDKLEHYRCDR